jgi:mRNA interferase MazF
MNRGEVWRVHLPSGPGRVQTGDRPAIILQEASFTTSLTTVLIAPFTSNLAAIRFAGTLLVQPNAQNGLSTPSVALVFQTRAVDKQWLLRRIGTLDQVFAIFDQLTDR